MSDVQVYHVGSPHPTLIRDADFNTYGDGGDQCLVVFRAEETLARFPAGKWSAAIKVDPPAQDT